MEYSTGDISQSEEPATPLFVGQHESQRETAVTLELQAKSQALGYDLLTAPITTSHFQSRVLAKLEEYVAELSNQQNDSESTSWPQISSFMPEDTDLEPQESNGALIGVISPWIDLGCKDPLIANVSRQVFHLEVAYAAFCGVSNILVPGPLPESDTIGYARVVLEGLGLGPYVQLHILMPMTGESELEGTEAAHLSHLARSKYVHEPTEDEDDEDEPEPFGTWVTWDTIRNLCHYSNRLSLALEVPRQLPSVNLQSRWYSESVRILVYPRTTFLRNAKGYPVLSKPHQQFLSHLIRLRFVPWILLADVDPISLASSIEENEVAEEPTPAEAAAKSQQSSVDPTSHLRYIRHLQFTQPARPPMERFGQGYQDYIQSPLQPLSDNLESITYEVFEKDPIKYEWYKRATAEALKDLHAARVNDGKPIVVAIVGAGRGPLVTRALQASKETQIPIRCFAVEKNPNAHVLLQRRNARDPLWNKSVTVVQSDMRSWRGPPSLSASHEQTTTSSATSAPASAQSYDKVDILISELLGSFADNELSPECLDGVQHVLHPDHGINIPQRYSAHCTPIATPRLHADVLGRPNSAEHWEIPSVVMLQQLDYLCTEPKTQTSPESDSKSEATTSSSPESIDQIIPAVQEAWSFSHPIPESVLARSAPDGFVAAGAARVDNSHNIRSCKLVFQAKNQGVCHGLGGYFETVLYASPTRKDIIVELSTNPVTMEAKSKEMISWFPIWFPLKTPLFVPDNAEIEVSMWRQTDDRKVWYEWAVEVFVSSPSPTNGKKKRSKIVGSEIHSSRANGCLM